MGNALNRLGRYEDALAAYDQAIRLDSSIVIPHNGRGNALHGLGRWAGPGRTGCATGGAGAVMMRKPAVM
jgi:tetratricopeptide (TPR) repeat protein